MLTRWPPEVATVRLLAQLLGHRRVDPIQVPLILQPIHDQRFPGLGSRANRECRISDNVLARLSHIYALDGLSRVVQGPRLRRIVGRRQDSPPARVGHRQYRVAAEQDVDNLPLTLHGHDPDLASNDDTHVLHQFMLKHPIFPFDIEGIRVCDISLPRCQPSLLGLHFIIEAHHGHILRAKGLSLEIPALLGPRQRGCLLSGLLRVDSVPVRNDSLSLHSSAYAMSQICIALFFLTVI